jgi:hypothetical protein
MAAQMIDLFKPPPGVKVCVLFDSFYLISATYLTILLCTDRRAFSITPQ